jgi:hypothetical protein
MRYPHFRHQKLFVGSGVIEAACRTSLRDANSPVCSGLSAVPTPSSLSAALDSTTASTTIGTLAPRPPDFPNIYVAHPRSSRAGWSHNSHSQMLVRSAASASGLRAPRVPCLCRSRR